MKLFLIACFEQDMFYMGGTAVAAQAGLMTDEEILSAANAMEENVQSVKQAGGHMTIGLTIYPPYPTGTTPFDVYEYQNGGDWTWFGARMIKVLIQQGIDLEL